MAQLAVAGLGAAFALQKPRPGPEEMAHREHHMSCCVSLIFSAYCSVLSCNGISDAFITDLNTTMKGDAKHKVWNASIWCFHCQAIYQMSVSVHQCCVLKCILEQLPTAKKHCEIHQCIMLESKQYGKNIRLDLRGNDWNPSGSPIDAA